MQYSIASKQTNWTENLLAEVIRGSDTRTHWQRQKRQIRTIQYNHFMRLFQSQSGLAICFIECYIILTLHYYSNHLHKCLLVNSRGESQGYRVWCANEMTIRDAVTNGLTVQMSGRWGQRRTKDNRGNESKQYTYSQAGVKSVFILKPVSSGGFFMQWKNLITCRCFVCKLEFSTESHMSRHPKRFLKLPCAEFIASFISL